MFFASKRARRSTGDTGPSLTPTLVFVEDDVLVATLLPDNECVAVLPVVDAGLTRLGCCCCPESDGGMARELPRVGRTKSLR
jgi:hypothetical protein